ncbi:DGQHR domain-containing protein [Shewanella algae]|uniref:DGQHR domain-containing protein n=1 Tax=Shewanella algae TaxID=38313 RepID=UPI003006A51D
MKKIKTNFLKVTQPIGDFYCCVMKANDLYKISYSDVRALHDEAEDGVGTYLGIQRNLSSARVKKIKEYVNSVDATFPNSIIIAIPEKYVVLNNCTLEISYESEKEGKIAKILDGQHRLAGFEDNNGKFVDKEGTEQDFEVLVTIFVEADLHTQAQVFTMVNQSQTKVNKSLVYDLESLAMARSPYKTGHQIAVLMNNRKDSPFYKRIKRLGVKTLGVNGELLTQAAFVENLIKLISKKPSLDRDILLGKKKSFIGLKEKKLPDNEIADYKRLVFRKSFVDNDDSTIAANIFNFFTAVSLRWNKAWGKENASSALNKTVGLIALIRLLRDICNGYVENGCYQYGDVISESDFSNVLKNIKVDDSFFESVDAVSKSSGYIYKRLSSYL